MNKDKFLTVRWNYTIALAQGLPTFGYVAYALSTKLWTTMTGMLVLSILGALFWIILELHSSARFAWLKECDPKAVGEQSLTRFNFFLLVLYSLIFWFFLIPFFTPMSYGTGFVVFTAILLIRFMANLYVNLRDFTPAQYYAFPYRIPWVLLSFFTFLNSTHTINNYLK